MCSDCFFWKFFLKKKVCHRCNTWVHWKWVENIFYHLHSLSFYLFIFLNCNKEIQFALKNIPALLACLFLFFYYLVLYLIKCFKKVFFYNFLFSFFYIDNFIFTIIIVFSRSRRNSKSVEIEIHENFSKKQKTKMAKYWMLNPHIFLSFILYPSLSIHFFLVLLGK